MRRHGCDRHGHLQRHGLWLCACPGISGCGCGCGCCGGCGANLYVGYNGIGDLTATSGASVSEPCASSNNYIGYNSSSNGTIAIDGMSGSTSSEFSATACFNNTYIGYSGRGALQVTNGGYFYETGSQSDYVGYNKGSTGTVAVDGTGNSGATRSNCT